MKLQCPSCESFIKQVTPSRALCEFCGGDWYVVTKWSSKCSAVMLVPRPPGAVRSEKEVEDRTNEQITRAIEKKLGKFGRIIVKETPLPDWYVDMINAANLGPWPPGPHYYFSPLSIGGGTKGWGIPPGGFKGYLPHSPFAADFWEDPTV